VEKKEKHQFGLLMEAELAEDLNRLAYEDDRPRSQYIIKTLKEKVREEKLKADQAS